jgi:NADH-quinone oxidoreductase subunit J
MFVTVFFYVLAAVAVGSALGVVLGKSPVASLLFMVTSLASVAWIYVLLEAHFIAAVQVMVYAGAILVLFLFVIMLLNLGHDYQRDLKGWGASLVMFVITGAMGGYLATRIMGPDAAAAFDARAAVNAAAMDEVIRQKGAVGAIAEPLFTTYAVPFEITGILLLVAIVGALALAKRREA